MEKTKGKLATFLESHTVVYYLIYIPLCVILLGWPVCGQTVAIYGWIAGWDNTDIQWWFWLLMIGSWLTIPVYGMILVVINWWLLDTDDEEKDIDRAYRSNVHYPNPDIPNLNKDLAEIRKRYP